MDVRAISEKILQTYGWRIGPGTARYILGQLQTAPKRSFPVFSQDARTGQPQHLKLNPADLQTDAQPTLF